MALPLLFTINSTLGDIMEDPRTAEMIKPFLAKTAEVFGSGDAEADGASSKEAISDEMVAAMFRDMPLGRTVSFSNGGIKQDDLTNLLAALNGVVGN